MGMFDGFLKALGGGSNAPTSAEEESRKKREAAAKPAEDARRRAEADAENKRRQTPGYQSEPAKNVSDFFKFFGPEKKKKGS